MYCKRKKSYFCDKQEEESDVRFRNEFITKKYEFETDTYRWVHLTEAAVIELEEQEDQPLLKNIYQEFEKRWC